MQEMIVGSLTSYQKSNADKANEEIDNLLAQASYIMSNPDEFVGVEEVEAVA